MALFTFGCMVTLLLSWLYKPTWLSKTSRAAKRSGGWFGKRQPALRPEAQYWQWATRSLAPRLAAAGSTPEEGVEAAAWLERFSEPEARNFMQTILTLCETAQLDPNWLLDENVDFARRQAVDALMLAYGLSLWRGKKIEAREALEAWRAAPNKKNNRVWGAQLFSNLLSAGVITMPPELALATAKETQAHIAQAIVTAEAENSAAFNTVLVKMKAGLT